MAEKPNSTEESTAAVNTAEDNELDDLLADALNDFGKPPPEHKDAVEESKPDQGQEKAPNPGRDGDELLSFAEFEKEMLSVLNGNLQEEMQQLLYQGIDPVDAEAFKENLRKMTEEAAKAFSEPNVDSEFSATINQALKNLSDGAENLPSYFGDENLMRMLSNMPTEGSDEIIPFMQQMMQALLSKDILYPALKDLSEKYDSWLRGNRSRLEVSDYDRFRKQESLVKEVCVILESEKETDDAAVKKQRFDRLIVVMHQIQDCGQPPNELMESIKPFEDMPSRSETAKTCAVM